MLKQVNLTVLNGVKDCISSSEIIPKNDVKMKVFTSQILPVVVVHPVCRLTHLVLMRSIVPYAGVFKVASLDHQKFPLSIVYMFLG